MRLTVQDLKNETVWKEKGYQLPSYDREQIVKNTAENPKWIHFGGGNIFRGFLADRMETMLNAGVEETGIIVASGKGSVEHVYRRNENLGICVVLKNDGQVEKKIIGSVTEALEMDSMSKDWERLKEIFRNPSLQMGSFTITEKAYKIDTPDGDFSEETKKDFEMGPDHPVSYMGKIAALCYERFQNGALPVAMVSMDNYSHNGTQLHRSVQAFADEWEKRELVKKGFAAYINDRSKVGFPWTMIDKITPGPSEEVRKILETDGIEGLDAILTERRTNTAAYVNVEETGYLVIEDCFPNGRPALDTTGVIFTDADTVDRVERMKVCTCLNPLHTALAVFGCLLGYTRISAEMKDPQLKALAEKIGYTEGLPVVTNPGILDPEEFIKTVLEVRFPNPFIPDSPQRIATDTSQKISIRYGVTVRSYMENPELKSEELTFIPMVYAGFLRYLLGVDDEGNEMQLSPDPMKEYLQKQLSGLKLGDTRIPEGMLEPIFANRELFGISLYDAGLAEKTEQLLIEMLAGKGAVRNTLVKYIKNK